MATKKKKTEEEIVNDVVETVDASTVEEQPAAKPKRKPLVRKVSAAPTKFAPKKPKEDIVIPVPSVIDDELDDIDDSEAYKEEEVSEAPKMSRAAVFLKKPI